MKKYLMTAMAAVAMGVAFTSCSHNTDFYGGEEGGGKINGRTVQEQIELDKAVYKASFEKAFGKVAPTVDWGFGGYTRAMTRALGDYDQYKGTMQPEVWVQELNNWQGGWMPYTFPSAPELPTTKPNATYYSGGSELKLNGETYWMDENTDGSYIDVKTHGDFYIVKSGTGEGNVTIAPPSWYVGNVDYGYKIRVFVCPGVTFKIPTSGAGNLQANVEYYFAPGANLICDASIKLNGTCIYIAGNTTAPKLEVNNNGIFYNMGTANISGQVSVENNNSIIVNDGTLTATDLLTKGSGRVQNNAELTISNKTIVNSDKNIWVNNGHYKTKYFEYTATSSSVINNCFLEVTEDFFMNISDGSGDFKIDAGGGVLTKNFYGGGVYGSFNGGPFKITMGSKSVFKVTNEAHLNALASAIATKHYGFEGVGNDYAVFQANKVLKDGTGEGNVAYSGKLYVSAEEHFAQGYSGQYPYIHYYDCSEANIYAPGFENGKPDITIEDTPCNPGFKGTERETYRVIAEDWSSKTESDFDFNDVVFDVDPRTDGEGGAKITILAAGGIWPLKIKAGGKEYEVHGLLGFGTRDVPYTLNGENYVCYRMINTGVKGEKGASTPTTDKKDMSSYFTVDSEEGYWDWDSDENIRKSIKDKIVVTVSLYDKGDDEIPAEEEVVLPAEQGEVACKILVDQDCDINSDY